MTMPVDCREEEFIYFTILKVWKTEERSSEKNSNVNNKTEFPLLIQFKGHNMMGSASRPMKPQ